MNSKIKVLGRETRCYCVDSKECKKTDADWFQGGMMSMMSGKMFSLMQH